MPKHNPRPKGKDLLLRDLPPRLHRLFKAYCNRRGLSMRKRIEQLMRVDIEKRKVQEIEKLVGEHNRETLLSMKAVKCNTPKS